MMKILTLAMVCCCVAVGSAAAATFDGSKPMICAPTSTTKCNHTDGCSTGEVHDFNLARFLRFDIANKTVSGVGTDRSSPITHVEHDGGQLILHGSQNARGWSATIAEDTGEMTATVSGNDAGFVIFGGCMVSP